MKNKAYSYAIKAAIIGGFALGSFSLAALADWTAPTTNPPSCPTNQPGCDAPIHTGGAAQTKRGSLVLYRDLKINADTGNQLPEGLQTWGKSIFNGIVQINAGDPARDRVLISTNVRGDAKWEDVSALLSRLGINSGGSNNIRVKMYTNPNGRLYGNIGRHTYCAQLNDQHGHDTNVGTQAMLLSMNPATGEWTVTRQPQNGNHDFPGVVCFDYGGNVSYEVVSM